MASKAQSKEESRKESLWDRFGRFVIKGPPIDAWDHDNGEEDDGKVKLRPGVTYKGL